MNPFVGMLVSPLINCVWGALDSGSSTPNIIRGYLHWLYAGGSSMTMKDVSWSLLTEGLSPGTYTNKALNAVANGLSGSEHIGVDDGSFSGITTQQGDKLIASGTFVPNVNRYDFDLRWPKKGSILADLTRDAVNLVGTIGGAASFGLRKLCE